MAELGISNIRTRKLVAPPCGKDCASCSPSEVSRCAAQLTRETGEIHSVVEVCESCGTSQATQVKYSESTTLKLCAACYRLIRMIQQIH